MRSNSTDPSSSHALKPKNADVGGSEYRRRYTTLTLRRPRSPIKVRWAGRVQVVKISTESLTAFQGLCCKCHGRDEEDVKGVKGSSEVNGICATGTGDIGVCASASFENA
jgi:hypothetical protein